MPPSLPSPASTISDAYLPTPDQPSSRRLSLVQIRSPRVVEMTGIHERQGSDEGDLFSPSSGTGTKPIAIAGAAGAGSYSEGAAPLLPEKLEGYTTRLAAPFETPAPNRRGTTPMIAISDSSAGSSQSARRASTPVGRAPPPPPIFLRRPTGLEKGEDEVVPLPGSAGSSAQGKEKAKGLNINGMLMPDIDSSEMEQDQYQEGEGEDSLADLAASPRLVFNNADAAPSSPAWQSFDASPSAGPGNSWTRKQSLDVPSPLGPRNNERRFDPTPQHGLHARNLSLFFPQPGAPGAPPRPLGVGGSAPGSPMMFDSPEPQEIIVPGVGGAGAGAGGQRKVFGGSGSWSFGQAQASGLEGSDLQTPEGVKRSQRRGHHHKHSLSHNFFSFLDPTQTNPALAASASPSSPLLRAPPSPGPDATPASVPMPLHAASAPTLSPLPPSKMDHHGQFLLSFAILEFLIGAGLWIEGQMSGWRCLAGVGYLVVFDAVGVGVQFLDGGGGGWSSLRRPYGSSRFNSLLYFAQSLFLVFAAVYIAKESIEQVVLGAGAHEHAVGGHGHGEAVMEGDERPFPHFLLFCATISSLFAGGALSNHSKLVDAVGPLFLPSSYLYLPFVARFPRLFANPFSMTVAGASAGILISTLVVPPTALHSLDSLISLLLTLLTSALSYPPTLAFGHVLLQTAPPAYQSQSLSIRRALQEIKDDRRVLGLGTMRCWATSAGKGHLEFLPSSSGGYTPGGSRAGSIAGSPKMERFSFSHSHSHSPNGSPRPPLLSLDSHSGSKDDPISISSNPQSSIPLVMTLVVHVHPDSSDRDLLEVTKFAWGRLNGAIMGTELGGSGGGRSGSVAGGGREGEVSVRVKRGWEGLEDT